MFRFILRVVELKSPMFVDYYREVSMKSFMGNSPIFHKLLKKNVLFQWSKELQAAFQKVKDIFSSPLTLILPIKDDSLFDF